MRINITSSNQRKNTFSSLHEITITYKDYKNKSTLMICLNVNIENLNI